MPGRDLVDPFEMEARFSNEDGWAYLEWGQQEPSSDMVKKLDRVKSVLESLPPREADFLDLYFFRRLKQTNIANIFRVSQPTVCYRLKRATSRIKFIFQLPNFDISEMETDLGGFLSDPVDVRIMALMYLTTCQSEVAKRLGVSQGLVRHRFIRSLKHMRHNPSMQKYVDVFDVISHNLNILREVQRIPAESAITHIIT